MIEETGTIVELKGKQVAVVLCKKSSFCKHCASMEACQIGNDNSSRLIEVHNFIGAQIGDEVKIATSTRSFLQSSFVLYLVPVMFLVLGASLGQLIGERLHNGPDPNLLAALVGVGFLVGGLLCIKVGTKSIKSEDFMPRITEVLTSAEAFSKDMGHGN
ncbi:SoxR reducing system RseC family protein [Geoalkalibacter sp.]|uniref:SoxR reducing system RseC family protein n=1 Tax=Geoalkalibacter sp. TaxID=3041440 RepID=UPI00272E81F8|nr:SoxR reducing system RseC family protein [Geoalkalibacter sp.]